MKAYRNLNQIVTLKKAHQLDGRNVTDDALSIIEKASVVFDEEKILWVGPDTDFPEQYSNAETTTLEEHILLPEIVDSHTHLLFGGDRSQEYAMRLNGRSYEEIAQSGGGILSTMKATNDLSREELFNLGKERIQTLHSYGIGTIEIKSGYALNLKKERELSEIISDLKKHFAPKIQIFNTFMAAHAVPQKFADSHSYLEQEVLPLLEELATKNIIDAVDIFHEDGYFNSTDVQKLFTKAKELGVPTKIHADEFQDNGGASMATEFGSLSADHLLQTNLSAIKKMAQSKTVATLLPGTSLFLGKPMANARKFFDEGVKVSLASDYNPGSCHCDNLLLLAQIAAPLYKLSLSELWTALTLNAAHALGLSEQGAIIEGLRPRFSLFKVNNLSQISYSWGKHFSASLP